MIDSALSRQEALGRFREGLPEVVGLSGGRTSRDSLVAGFFDALQSRDSATLRALVLTKPEFAYLYYPSSPQSLPPYDLTPDLMWFMNGLQGDEGIRNVLNEFGGTGSILLGYECPKVPSDQGENRVWAPCPVRWSDAKGSQSSDRLFGAILERGGVYKFVNYSRGGD